MKVGPEIFWALYIWGIVSIVGWVVIFIKTPAAEWISCMIKKGTLLVDKPRGTSIVDFKVGKKEGKAIIGRKKGKEFIHFINRHDPGYLTKHGKMPIHFTNSPNSFTAPQEFYARVMRMRELTGFRIEDYSGYVAAVEKLQEKFPDQDFTIKPFETYNITDLDYMYPFNADMDDINTKMEQEKAMAASEGSFSMKKAMPIFLILCGVAVVFIAASVLYPKLMAGQACPAVQVLIENLTHSPNLVQTPITP